MMRTLIGDRPISSQLAASRYVVGDHAGTNQVEFLTPHDHEYPVFFSSIKTMLKRKGAPLSSNAWAPKVLPY